MAIQVASETSNVENGDGSDVLTLNKPNGLSENDLLFAVLAKSDSTINDKTGWTTIREIDQTGNGWGEIKQMYKVASSSDASSSDFTFNSANNFRGFAGVLYRITGHPINVTPIDGDTSGSDNDSSIKIDGLAFTPDFDNNLQIMQLFVRDDFADGSLSNYATNDTNVSWTESQDTAIDTDQTDPFDRHGVAYGKQNTASQITEIGADYSSGSNSGAFGIITVLRPQIDEGGTATLIEESGTIFTTNGSGGTNGDASLLEGSTNIFTASGSASEEIWSNESRSSTNWTNESK